MFYEADLSGKTLRAPENNHIVLTSGCKLHYQNVLMETTANIIKFKF
jgi:hypothetical protein